MEKLVGPVLIEPTQPSLTEKNENTKRGQVPDPDNEGQTIEGEVSVTRKREVQVTQMKAHKALCTYPSTLPT